MPFLTIAFPVFDPIALSIGPIAIRWYALAYIGGIVLGWIYARSLVKNARLWGGPAPITLVQATGKYMPIREVDASLMWADFIGDASWVTQLGKPV